MINILKQSGKSICYLLVMLLPQVIVSVVITVGVIACLSMSNQAIFEYEAVMDSIYELMNPISIVSGLMSLYILFLYFTIREKNFFREVGIRKLRIKYLFSLITLTVFFAIFIQYVFSYIPMQYLESYIALTERVMTGSPVLLAISTVIVAPIIEECIFRGLIFMRLTRAMPVWVAAIIASVVFGVVHGHIVWATYAFVMGLVLCFVFYKTKSLLASILVHMLFNALGSVVPMPNIDFSPVLNPVAMVVCAVGCVLSLMYILKSSEA